MAVGVDVEAVQYNGKITWFVLLSCAVAAIGALIFGYSTTVTGGVTSMEPFLEKFFPVIYKKMQQDTTISNYCKFDSQLLTFFTSSLFVSGLMATFVAAPVTKALGRRISILVGAATSIAGSALGGAAENVYMLLFGRLLLGVGVGFINQSVPLYLSEMAPPKYRGAFNYLFQLCVALGGLVSFLVNYGMEKIKRDWGWRVSLATTMVPALILTICAPYLPETPNSFIQQGKDQAKAKKILQKIRGTDDVQAEFDDLITANNASKTIKHPFKNILQRKYRPQLVMSIAIPFFQQVTGISAVSFYAPILFLTIGSGVSASLLSSVVLGIVGAIMTLLSLFLVDKVGRRALFQVGGVQMFLPLMVIGGIMASKLGDYGGLSSGYNILVLILICLYVVGFAISWGGLAWLVTSEIFPLEIRSAAQSINVAVSFLVTYVSTQTFITMLCHFKSAIFFFFAAWVLLMTGFVYILLPETKAVPIEKMDKIWREHRFWKTFVGHAQEYEVEK